MLNTSLIFWSTLLIYQINTKIDFNSFDLNAYKSFKFPLNKRLQIGILILIIIILHLPFIKVTATLYLLHLGILSTLYNAPKNSKGFIRLPLRSIPILKIFLIAYVWASISSFLPAILDGTQIFQEKNLMIFCAHFLFIIAITLPFDIRDFKSDKNNFLQTIPHLIGEIPTKLFALFCLSGFYLIISNYLDHGFLMLFSILTGVLILLSSPRRNYYYYLLFIDGTIMLYFFMIILSLK